MSAWRMTPTSSCAGSDAALSRALSAHASSLCPPLSPPRVPAGRVRSPVPPGGSTARPAARCRRPAASPPRRQGALSEAPLPQRRGRHGRRAWAAAARRGRGAGASPAGLRAARHRRAGVRGHGGGVSVGAEDERGALNGGSPLGLWEHRRGPVWGLPRGHSGVRRGSQKVLGRQEKSWF